LSNVSNSIGSVLKPAGLDNAKGLINAQYLKDPTDPTWKDDQDYKDWSAFMDKYYPEGDKTSSFTAYGCMEAQALAEVLKRCGDTLTRENVMKQAANLKDLKLKMLLPGVVLNTRPNDFSRSNKCSCNVSTARAGSYSGR
jgi:branched-chain amino acid transport system substrate-binding protein